MENNILRIDLDIKTKKQAIKHLNQRLSYFHDIKFLYVNKIKKIELIKKSTYGCRIFLNCKFKPVWIILLQSLLGSDYMKEVNTCINHFRDGMQYSNRLFIVKRYTDNTLKTAQIIDVTKQIKDYILSNNRKVNYN